MNISLANKHCAFSCWGERQKPAKILNLSPWYLSLFWNRGILHTMTNDSLPCKLIPFPFLYVYRPRPAKEYGLNMWVLSKLKMHICSDRFFDITSGHFQRPPQNAKNFIRSYLNVQLISCAIKFDIDKLSLISMCRFLIDSWNIWLLKLVLCFTID